MRTRPIGIVVASRTEVVFGTSFTIAGGVLLTYAEELADSPTLLGGYGAGLLRLAGISFLAAGLLDIIVAFLIYSLKKRAIMAAVVLCPLSASFTIYLLTQGVITGMINALLNLILPVYLLLPAVRYEFD